MEYFPQSPPYWLQKYLYLILSLFLPFPNWAWSRSGVYIHMEPTTFASTSSAGKFAVTSKANTFMGSVKPKALFLLMLVGDESGIYGTLTHIVHIGVLCIETWRNGVIHGVILLSNQGDAPFIQCVLCAGVTQTDSPLTFFPILQMLLYINMPDISCRILSLIYHKQGMLCYSDVSAVYEETRGGPISLCLEIAYRQSQL